MINSKSIDIYLLNCLMMMKKKIKWFPLFVFNKLYYYLLSNKNVFVCF